MTNFKEDILVSVNCLTYNHEKYIAKTLDSILMQKTNFKFEVLIHDDASSDNTKKIIEQYQNKFPDIIKPIFQYENKYSKGIKRIGYIYNHKRANGKYIAWCEGDDYWIDENKLQKQIDYMEKNNKCTLIFHNAERIDDLTGESMGYMINKEWENSEFNVEEIFKYGFIPTASVIYRKLALDNPPDWYFDAITGDLATNLIVANFGYIYYMKDVMSVYRVGNVNSMMNQWKLNNTSIDSRIKHQLGFINLFNNFDDFSNHKYSDQISNVKKDFEFELFRLQGKISELKDKKYKDKYSQLTLMDKLKIYLLKYAPKLFGEFSKIKLEILKKVK
ncbi:hypothetical protein BFS06_10335 [Clostridium perfringens]|uniref:glycosyltransferase n=1 Tax=Clostridium perfringens TaxID=1502 RepID=UPI00103A143E|nr:glycosyltransferase [Clostridium perfringens]MDM0626624.1 glycosyltransferase [Clostridium perfringens]TBX15203.1 hypothetical protein BFS06_10335 [Clostridium perfringens]